MYACKHASNHGSLQLSLLPKKDTARPRDTRFLIPEKNRASQNRPSWGLYLCTKWDFFSKNSVSSRLLFKIRVSWGYTYVLKGIFIAYFLGYSAIGTFGQLGPSSNWYLQVNGTFWQLKPLGNWDLWAIGKLEPLGNWDIIHSKNHTITVIKDVTSDINESAIRICTGCENDLSASYYCIKCSENICEHCFDAHKKVKLTKNYTLNPLAIWRQ